MEKDRNPYVSDVTDLKLITIREYIEAWLAVDKTRTIQQFAELSGISERTIKYYKNYVEGETKLDPRLSTIKAILRTLNQKPTISPISDKDAIK